MGESYQSQSPHPRTQSSQVGRNVSLAGALGIFAGTQDKNSVLGVWDAGSFGPKTRGHFASMDLNILTCKMGPVLGIWDSWSPMFLLPHILPTGQGCLPQLTDGQRAPSQGRNACLLPSPWLPAPPIIRHSGIQKPPCHHRRGVRWP